MSWRLAVADPPPVLKVYAVLYTHQKHKKSKTWQDGKVKLYQNTSKAVLFDDKGFKLDSHFCKGRPVVIGELYDFDRHLVVFDEFLFEEAENSAEQPSLRAPQTPTRALPVLNTAGVLGLRSQTRQAFPAQAASCLTARCETVPPSATPRGGAQPSPPLTDEFPGEKEPSRKRSRTSSSAFETRAFSPVVDSGDPNGRAFPSKAPDQRLGSSVKFKTPPPSGLYFPSMDTCGNRNPHTMGPPMRKMRVGVRFQSLHSYRDTMVLLVNEHLQVLLLQLALQYHQLRTQLVRCGRSVVDSESLFRARGCHLHVNCCIRPPHIAAMHASGRSLLTSSHVLVVGNRQLSSIYSKDDLWLVSNSDEFPTGSTFLARSTFYGLSSNSTLEVSLLEYGISGSNVPAHQRSLCKLQCLSTRDTEIAKCISEKVFAIRVMNCTSEFLMLDSLQGMLLGPRCPLITSLVNWTPKVSGMATDPRKFRPPRPRFEVSQCVNLPNMDTAELDALIDEWMREFSLNADQESVCKAFAKRTIRAQNQRLMADSDLPPVLLVHGVFGAGKSYLMAVLIVLLHRVMALPGAQVKHKNVVLVTSLTNVAVDRILLALLDLGFRDFVRVGSVKKIAKPILPFTAQGKADHAGEIKELEAMLREEIPSSSDRDNVQEALKKFREERAKSPVSSASVVGTTCMASNFDIFANMKFSIAILDESSQIAEAMAIVPLVRFQCDFAVLVGDPKQLSPTLATPAAEASHKQGLDRTIFDRAAKLNINPVVLRTQYRCHPDISAVANEMFYDGTLIDGVSAEERSPIVDGLPTLCMVNVTGVEEQQPHTKSFLNKKEATFTVDFVRRLRQIGVRAADVGVICLYKAQADVIGTELNGTGRTREAVQVSTVDAIQGSEKNVIILSCVRTREVGFIDNIERVTVAVTRSKRHLILVGDAGLLSNSPLLCGIISGHIKSVPGRFLDENEMRKRMSRFSSLHGSAISSCEENMETRRSQVGQSAQQPASDARLSRAGSEIAIGSSVVPVVDEDAADNLLDAFDGSPKVAYEESPVGPACGKPVSPLVDGKCDVVGGSEVEDFRAKCGKNDTEISEMPLSRACTTLGVFSVGLTGSRLRPPGKSKKEESEVDGGFDLATIGNETRPSAFEPETATDRATEDSQPTLDDTHGVLDSFAYALKKLRDGPPMSRRAPTAPSPPAATTMAPEYYTPRTPRGSGAPDFFGLEDFELDDFELSD